MIVDVDNFQIEECDPWGNDSGTPKREQRPRRKFAKGYKMG